MADLDPQPMLELLRPSLNHYKAMLEKLVTAVSAERGCLYLEKENELLYHGDEQLRQKFPFSRDAVLSVLDEGRAFLCLDAANAPKSQGTGSVMINTVRSVLCAAARDVNGEILVLAYFDNKGTSGCFPPESLKLLKSVLGHIPGAVPQKEEPEKPPVPEVGVLAWSEGKVVMVSPQGQGQWRVPRGSIEGGDPDQVGRASLLAWQEAGITGTLSDSLGSYLYTSDEKTYRVKLFGLADAKLHEEWPLAKLHQRKLMLPEEASALIEEPGLRTLIARSAAEQSHWTQPEPPLPYFSNEYEEATREYLKPFAELLSDPTEENLGLALEMLMEEHFAERGCLWIENEGGERTLIYRGDEELKDKFPFSRQVVETALETGQGFVSFNPESDERFGPEASIISHGVRSVLCSAARDDSGKPLVVVYFDNKSSAGNFTSEDLKLLDQVMALYPGACPAEKATV